MFNKEKKQKRFIVKEEQNIGLGALYVVLDTKTGVNYIMSGVSYAMTPLLDSNGNIVIDKIEK